MDKFKRAVAIGSLEKGYKPHHIAKDLGVSPSSITRLRAKVVKLGKERSLKNAPVRLIINLIKRRPFLSAVRIKRVLAPTINHLSTRMVQKVLFRAGYKAFQAAKKPVLTAQMKPKRIAFATDHLHWTPQMWFKVMFSDESTFRLIRGTKKTVRRRFRSDTYAEP